MEETAANIYLRVQDWTTVARGLIFTLGLDLKKAHVFMVFIDHHVLVR